MKWVDIFLLSLSLCLVIFSFQGSEWEGGISPLFIYPLSSPSLLPPDFENKARPIIVDVDGDGSSEIIVVSEDSKLQLLKVKEGRNTIKEGTNTITNEKERQEEEEEEEEEEERGRDRNEWKKMAHFSQSVKISASVSLRKMGYNELRASSAVGLSAGNLGTAEVPNVVVVVVMESGVVFCFDSKLRMVWEASLNDQEDQRDLYEDVAIAFTPEALQIGDQGAVIIGARAKEREKTSHFVHEHDDVAEEALREKEKNLQIEIPAVLEELEQPTHPQNSHFNYFAFEGKTGGRRWAHKSSDFRSFSEHDHEETFEQFLPSHIHRLHVAAQSHRKHSGQANWREYRKSVLEHLPHQVSHVRGTENPFPNTLQVSHFSRSSSLVKRTDSKLPNVVVSHTREGMEVLHLFTGRPLCFVPFSSDAIYVDGDGDDVVESVRPIVRYGKSLEPHTTARGAGRVNMGQCYAECLSGSEQLWNFSVCNQRRKIVAPVGDMDYAFDAQNYLQQETNDIFGLFEIRSTTVQKMDTDIESFFPRPPSSSVASLTFLTKETKNYNYVFLASSGLVSCVTSRGRLKWQAKTKSTWKPAPLNTQWNQPNVWSFDGKETSQVVGEPFITQFGEKEYLLAVGSCATLLRSEDGVIVSQVCFENDIIPRFVSIGDINSDNSPDFVVFSQGMLKGYSVQFGFNRISVLFSAMILASILVMFAIAVWGKITANNLSDQHKEL